MRLAAHAQAAPLPGPAPAVSRPSWEWGWTCSTDTDGLKRACNYFEAAAGAFKFVSERFGSLPSQDMSATTLQLLLQLMLAQAQEVRVPGGADEPARS